jgi:subtilase family serine protease
LPRPKRVKRQISRAVSKDGSAPDGSGNLFGDDFRNAYVPGTTLTGAGQSVGLVEFDGYNASDIATYASRAGGGRTNIIIQPVHIDGFNGAAGAGEGEVALDIELAMAIAPGLHKIVSFEAALGQPQNDVLNAMLAATNVLNLSCSWSWGGPSGTADSIFKSMAAVGQSFFNASGDSDAFTPAANSTNGVDNPSAYNGPSSSPYITQVGGTTLSVNWWDQSYAGETVWNWGVQSDGSYLGSSGGISTYYTIPKWQSTNISNLGARGGSTTHRNIPDVAADSDNVYEFDAGADDPYIGGTSCAAPLWAGFMALVNQQRVINGKKPVGLINPTVYTLAASSNYLSCFNDVTSGDNTWLPSSPNLFFATNGYDLCTGLGTMNGTNLINALAGPPQNFFTLQAPLGNDWYYLAKGTNHIFGYYSTVYFPYIFHQDMGWEYFIDADNAAHGGYFYDFTDGVFFYTEPGLFPYIYDYNVGSWMYYDPTSQPGVYTSNPRWFLNTSTKAWTNNL